MVGIISLAEFRQSVKRKENEAASNYTDVDLSELFGKNVTVWRTNGQDEVHRKAPLLGFYTKEEYQSFVARVKSLAKWLLSDAIESLNVTCGFPVIEVEDSTDGSPILLYIARAGDKACILNISSSLDRQCAIERALKWISRCQYRHKHGDPILVDLYGELLKAEEEGNASVL